MEDSTSPLKELIEINWPLTEVRVGELLRKSSHSRVGTIESKQGKYIYKIAHAWKTSESIERDLTTFDFLNNVGFKHISRLLKTKSGKSHIQFDDNLLYLIEYVHGMHPDNSSKTYGELGRITGVLHNIPGFPFKTDFDADIVIGDLKKNGDNFEFGKEYVETLKQIRSFGNLPRTLIHTDISPTNTIQQENGNFIVIDWDEAGIGTTALDVGQPLINQFIFEDLEFHKDWAEAFYKNYFQQRKLADREMDFVFDAALFWACMYIIYGDTSKRWKRIQWALENKKLLEAVIQSAT